MIKAYEAVPDVVKDDHQGRGRFVACLLRTAGHDFMDFRHGTAEKKKGGSDGCINLRDDDNEGLEFCLTKFGIPAVYNEVKKLVSFADFLVIAGEAITARAATDPESLALKYKKGFKYGRRTVTKCKWNHGRLPNPEHGCQGGDNDEDGLK